MRMLQRTRTSRSRRGSVAVLAALLMTFLIGMIAFAVDLGYLCVVQTQAQAAADAASMAGAMSLAGSASQAIASAQSCAALNTVNGQSVSLPSSAVVLGTWNSTAGTFGALSGSGTNNASACQVTVNLTSANGNPVNLFFAKVLGVQSANIVAKSTATAKRWDIIMSQDISQSYSADLSYATSGHLALLGDFKQYSPLSYAGFVQHTGWGSTWVALQQVGANYSSMYSTISNLQDSTNNTTSAYNVYGGTTTSIAVTTQTPASSGSDLATGIQQAINMFNSSAYTSVVPAGTARAIVISSDGESNASSNGQHPSPTYTDAQLNTLAQTTAQAAWNTYGISVYVVFYYHGSDSGADTTLLQSLVQGNGTFTEVSNPASIPSTVESLFHGGMSFGVVQ
jgi:Flp pilus assembly protein TadG